MTIRLLFAHRARRLFFFIHLWLGVVLGIWFSLLGLSGSALAWRFELQGLEIARRYPIDSSANGGKMISLSQAVDAFKATHPDATPKESANVTVPNRKMPFYAFARGKDRKSRQTIVVDPYSGQVHPPVMMRSLSIGTIQQFHQRLIAGAKGYVFNGFLNFLAIPLVLSGLWLWWPNKLKHLKAHLIIKRGVSFKRTMHDLHNVLGIYLYSTLLVTTLTGAMLVQQHISADGGIASFLKEESASKREGQNNREQKKSEGRQERRTEPKLPRITPLGTRLADDALLEKSRAVRPNLELSRLEMPLRPDQPLALSFHKPSGLNLSETVLLDPYTGNEIAGHSVEQGPPRDPLRTWTKVLHLGEFGGVFTKSVYTLTGLLPLALFVTGLLMWWKRKQSQKPNRAQNNN
jgi:uncharacterized iron-regulated membrane protein